MLKLQMQMMSMLPLPMFIVFCFGWLEHNEHSINLVFNSYTISACMDYLPIIAGILVALFYGVSDYLAGRSSKAVGEYRTTIYVLLFSSIILALALLYTGITAQLTSSLMVIVILFSVVFFVAQLLVFRAFRYGDLSVTAPIVGSSPIITVAGAVLILGDILSASEAAAIALIIVGIILVSTKASAFRTKKKIVAAGVSSAVLSMLFFGAFYIYLGAYDAAVGYTLLVFMSRVMGPVVGFAFGCATKQNLSFPQKKYATKIVIAGATDAVAVLVYAYSIFVNSAGLPIVAALAGFAGGVTVICAFAFLKERPEKNQWLGIILAIIGVVVLSYFS